MSNCKMEISVLLAFILCVVLGQMTAFAEDCNGVRENALRLHIMANSDSPDDQQLKLQVRDRILQEYAFVFGESETLEQAKIVAEDLLGEIVAVAEDELRKSGSTQSVTASVKEMYFTTRVYENFTLPAGNYQALQVVLGAGEGKNWWCVMYPPMCIPAAIKQENPTVQEIVEIGEQVNFIPKFAIVEFFQEQKSKIK